MVEQHSGEGASSSDASVSNPDSTLELNIKTLDSRIYTFNVEKNIPVLSFKGKIADQIGVPVGLQRLIFRGKVLKDEHSLSEYHVENGDTLHLVERLPTQEQPAFGVGADASRNAGSQGNDATASVPRNRIGQFSHSVVLGTFNMGDQGEGTGSDLTRVIGAVLNSLGVGIQGSANGPNSAATSQSGSAPQGSNTEQGQGRTGASSQTQPHFGQSLFNHPLSVPFMGASVPPPSVNVAIPDSLHTISEFTSRMEEVLAQNGSEASSSTANSLDQSPPGLSSDARGLPTLEALSVVLRHAQRLLSGPAVSALARIAGRLEQEAGSMDSSVRSQIQSESVQVALAMQHLGALFLELGRTMLMLRMGQSPAEAAINSGHAVYISSSGPNSIMVQPFPNQISPLFNPPATGPNSGTSIPIGVVGSAPRNINIHIHAGGATLPPMVSPIVARTAGGEGILDEHNVSTASADSGVARVVPLRNVIATAVPSRSATIAVTPATSISQPIGGVATLQPPEIAAMVSELNSQIRNLVENMRTDNLNSAIQQENSVAPNSSVVSGGAGDTINPSNITHSESREEAREFCGFFHELQAEHATNLQSDSLKSDEESSGVGEPSTSCVNRELSEHPESNLKDYETLSASSKSTGLTEVPLGLGGGLQPKRRGQQSKIQLKRGQGETSSSTDQSQVARTSGQQILQSRLSESTHGRSTSDAPVGTLQGLGQVPEDVQTGGQFDVTGMMSQLLDSPAMNGLLSGVAQQTGVGSPNVLRNMLQQFTQNPAMRNTVNQLAQQVNRDDVSNMFAGAGTGQGSNLDFSSMFQQMMPVVSQVLGSVSVENEQVQSLVPDLPPQVDSGDERPFSRDHRSDIQEVIHQIAARGSYQDIFRALIQISADISGNSVDEVVEALLSNEELVGLFREILRHDMRHQLEDDSAQGNES